MWPPPDRAIVGLIILAIIISVQISIWWLDYLTPLPDPVYRFKVVMDYAPFIPRTKTVYRCTEKRAWDTARRHIKRVPTGSAEILQRRHSRKRRGEG